MPSDGSLEGVATVNTAIAGSGNKRKRVTNDDNEVPKAKRGTKTKKKVKAEVEPKEGTDIEDVDEGLGGNGETADVNEEIDKVHEGAHEGFDEADDMDV
jgi:hypothetical protein